MLIPFVRSDLERKDIFSFSCNRCLQCCRAKKIQVNPYEIARIAGNFGISTTDCIQKYTVENGSFLKFDETDTCLFLGREGCTIHPDRPLVCRLYPLARHVNDREIEWFSEMERESECRGLCGTATTIQEYLDEQDTGDYIAAANRYLKLLWEMMHVLEKSGYSEDNPDNPDEKGTLANSPDENIVWTDMDAAVKKYCMEIRSVVPSSIEEKMRMHLDALLLWTNPS
ncbi:MAG: YkgJ family cysteine cluster protein [Chlorobiaceae bacterium]|nr:YkgJ family cysteine cluster protein [Chlorobiaceae bacterium]